jgi:hypothetical protein
MVLVHRKPIEETMMPRKYVMRLEDIFSAATVKKVR